jgi:hypothetical protein
MTVAGLDEEIDGRFQRQDAAFQSAFGKLSEEDLNGIQSGTPRSPDVLLRAVPVRHHRLERLLIGGGHFDLDPLAHGRALSWPDENALLDLTH